MNAIPELTVAPKRARGASATHLPTAVLPVALTHLVTRLADLTGQSGPIFYGIGQMGADTHLVCLTEPLSEPLVQLAEAIDAEVVDIQALGVRPDRVIRASSTRRCRSRYPRSARSPRTAPANPRRVPLSVIAVLEIA